MKPTPDATFTVRLGDLLAGVLARCGRGRRAEVVEGEHRTVTWFDARGRRRRVLVFERGELVKIERFWRDGRRRVLGHVKSGRADGEWFLVHRDGTLDRARTGLYRDGRWIGGLRGFNDWLGSA